MSSLKVNMETHIALDGCPSVPPEKKALLEKMLTKRVTDALGHTNFGLKLVDDENGFVVGAFLDCRTVAAADRAVAKLNKLRLTKVDMLLVNRWSDFADMENVDEEYYGMDEDEDQASAAEVTNPMMTDRLARPQIIIKAGEQFDVNWSWIFTTTGRMEPVKPSSELAPWAAEDRRVKKLQPGMPSPLPMWSPQGTYVVTRDKESIKLWGGKGTNMIADFHAPEARLVQISPLEKYIVIYDREFTFYEIATGRKIRTIAGEAPYWPVFKYNSDDTLCATFTADKGTILVFDAESMELKKEDSTKPHTIQEDGMCAFSWSPTNAEVFAYAVAGDDNMGYRVQIDKVVCFEDTEDSKHACEVRQLCRRNYFGTKALNLLWHPFGNFLAAKITKTTGQMAFGVFRVGPHNASAEALEIKGEPMRFNWQPNSGRFAIIMAESKTQKQRINFYEMQKPGFKEVGSFTTGGVTLLWAPKGCRCVSINYTTSRLEFYGVQGCGPFPSDQKMGLVASVEHPMVTDAEWDPTGRFLCSYVSSLKQQMDNAWMIWNVNGQKIFEQKIVRLSHATWRPLAPTLLSADDVTRVKKELPAKSKKYQEEALAMQRKVDESAGKKKRDQMEKYRRVMDMIHYHHVDNDVEEKRAALIAASPSMKALKAKLAKEAEVTEEIEVEA